MEWLNYHHLLYFWLVAREGSLAGASAELRLSQPALSGQIRKLEGSLGEKLFVKSGRRMVLSETGRMVFRYADEIFTLGREMQDTLKDRPVGRPIRVTVGIANVIPKTVVREMLEPALKLPGPIRLVCREDRPDRLLAELAMHELDVVLSDAPASSQIKIKAFNHLLGECDMVFLGSPDIAARFRKNFPASLGGAPMLLPMENTALRRALDHWFEENGIRPQIVGEFDDSALMFVFGRSGAGIFPVASIIADEVTSQFNVRVVGRLKEVSQRFYAITVERRLVHPAAVAICHEARKLLSRGAEG